MSSPNDSKCIESDGDPVNFDVKQIRKRKHKIVAMLVSFIKKALYNL